MPKALILGLLSLMLAACAGAAEPLADVGPFSTDPTVSLALVSVRAAAVTVKISSTHFTAIPAASATTPHKIGEGHYHLFLDVLPTAPGEVIPKTAGVFHTADSLFTIPTVPNGHHKLYVVLGYSDHTPYQHVDVVSARPHGAIALLEFAVTGSDFTAPTVVPSPSQSTALVPSAAPSTSSSTPSGTGKTVDVKVAFDATNSGKFDPSSVAAKVGDTVKWTFVDDTNNPHTVTSDDGSTFDSQPKVTGNKGDTFTFTFTKAGSFAYHCTFHANMKGTMTVS